ncbi:MAG: hypothetical protein ACKVZH_25655 [Blastocatellia bacterium]
MFVKAMAQPQRFKALLCLWARACHENNHATPFFLNHPQLSLPTVLRVGFYDEARGILVWGVCRALPLIRAQS